MKIYLVRHTEFDNPENIFPFHLPFVLSEKGRKDAIKIGKWLVKNRVIKLPIYSSPIVRTMETAKLIALKTKSSIKADKRLIEVACPNLQGKKRPEDKKWKVEQEDKSRELEEKVINRMKDIYNEKIRMGKDCILVSHGEPITFFYFDLIGKRIPKYPWSPRHQNIVVKRGEVVKIEIENKQLVRVQKFSPLLME